MATPTYAYAFNNPLQYTDRTGLFGEGAAEFPWWLPAGATGAMAAQAAGEAAGVLGVGAAAVGAVGLAGFVLGVGPRQFPDPGAGVPYPRPSPAPVPYFPGEPGVPFDPAAAGAAAAGALVCMAEVRSMICTYQPEKQIELPLPGMARCRYVCPNGKIVFVDDPGVGCDAAIPVPL